MLFLQSTPIIYFFGVFGYTPEHVVEKNGQKFVAYVSGFKRTYVNYYDYKNIFVVGNQKRKEQKNIMARVDLIQQKINMDMNISLKGQHAMMKRERLYL